MPRPLDGYGGSMAGRSWQTGLPAYMAGVYFQMAAGVALSALCALLVSENAGVANVLFTDAGMTVVGWIVTLAPLGLVFLLSAGVERMSPATARGVFILYAALAGLSLGGLLLAYTGASVGYTFIGAAAGFIALAAFGAVTRRDMSGLGVFLTITLVGLVVTTLLNLFLRSPGIDFFVAAVGIFLFAGLTAYDVQRLQRFYAEGRAAGRDNMAVLGALTLYLDFLNLFLSLLRFTGRRRR